MSVFRCYTEKKPGFEVEANRLRSDLVDLFGLKTDYIRLFNRYDLEGIDTRSYNEAKHSILSEPQTDFFYDEKLPQLHGEHFIVAVEVLPGQYDQRADSCAQCIQIMTRGERPVVKTAKIYVFGGSFSKEETDLIEKYIINPVDSRKACMSKPDTLAMELEPPKQVEIINGFIDFDAAELVSVQQRYGLAMDIEDLLFLQKYFISENRNPTLTELRVVDTYWSDHCRHTTFSTHIINTEIQDERVNRAFTEYLNARREVYGDAAESRPVTLMDIATMGMKLLKKRGLLPHLDESDEINACSVKVTASIDGKPEQWLLMFKNETHNHPTEIEPYGGAATCLGGAIRDPLSGRAYVYQAMRVTGSGDPTVPISETLEGKLPQRQITTTAALGYSSYGNQIGVATGLVQEIYHPGYIAKRMEIGAVVGAAPASNVVRSRPEPGDLIVLLGGRTGRDGCGGATGSSKSQTLSSIEECAAEVQKGNPPEERKIQRLFRNPEVTRLIKKCNDFGAGGVSVAIGELADGLWIDLDCVPKKYEGLDGTELAISESQERMAVVVAEGDVDKLIHQAGKENLEATVVARVTEEPRLRMSWNGQVIVDIDREFLNTNGATKRMDVHVVSKSHTQGNEKGCAQINFGVDNDSVEKEGEKALTSEKFEKIPETKSGSVEERLLKLVSDLNTASQRGLVEQFDSTVGSASVLVPFGGQTQRTPTQVMAALLPAHSGDCTTCSVMSFGFDPYLLEHDPFEGAATAVVQSVSRLVASGCDHKNAYLSFQEYFERLGTDPKRWGKPFSALLGAFTAQAGLKIASIGGKDSMSGSFMDMDVPPTLVSFSIATEDAATIISPEFKSAGNPVYVFCAASAFDFEGLKNIWDHVYHLIKSGKVISAWAAGRNGIAEGLVKMSFGNQIGFRANSNISADHFFEKAYTSIVVEATEPLETGFHIGHTTAEPAIEIESKKVSLNKLLRTWEAPLEKVFPTRVPNSGKVEVVSCYDRSPLLLASNIPQPLALIPVFPGTNCEYDTAKAVEAAGGRAEILVIRNLSSQALEQSAEYFAKRIAEAQMIILPGGFSGGDEPDGSAKFIVSFFRNPSIAEATHDLLYKNDGLMLGICNGFQALVKLGLLPFGYIRQMDESCPTLTFNTIGRHQSRYVLTRVASVKSPWLSQCSVGDVHAVPVSHGEGRFVAPESVLKSLIDNGQIAFQYTDSMGDPSMDIKYNPNGSLYAIEGVISPDGRILGKMGHTERAGKYIAKNIPFNKSQRLFEAGVDYFK
ncbi:MAG: phosphoribosylformylglycinamidine synthase subunit PurQ [Eubacteriales bacterium]